MSLSSSGWQGPVVHEAAIGALDDLNHVIDGVSQNYPWLQANCREDQVLELAVDSAESIAREQLLKLAVAELVDHRFGDLQ